MIKIPFSGLNENILDSGRRAGVLIPYGCRNGRCSSCKCRIISGETLLIQDEFGLTDVEKNDGWILSCVRSAKTELLLDVENLNDAKLPKAKMIPCRINQIKKMSSDVIVVTLRTPPETDFQFFPGQFVEVIGARGLRRSYSLANASFADKQLELHIRAVEGGAMSQYWFGPAKANDLLRLNGPLGTFFLRDVAGLDLVFLATGTGIAPVKAMLESMHDLAAENQPRSVTVLWGGRTPQDLYFDVAGIAGAFNFVPVLSRADAQWTGARGHVQHALLSVLPDLSQAAVYACGSDAMIRDAQTTLTAAGLPNNRFYSDAFVCSAAN